MPPKFAAVAARIRRALSRQAVAAAAALALLALAAFALLASAPTPQPELRELPTLTVAALTVRREDVTPAAEYTGRLQPRRRAELRFEVSGRLTERRVEPGMAVRAGDVLLALDDRDFRDAARTAEAERELEASRIERDRRRLVQAERRRDLQRREVERSRALALGERALLSQSALAAAEQSLAELEAAVAGLAHEVATAGARIAVAEARADRAAHDLARARLTAPFDGRVNAVAAEIGDRITDARMAVELVDVAALDFYVEVDGATAAALELNQKFAVAAGGRAHPGRLVALQADPDPRTFTHAVRIRIPGDGALPGQLARTRMPLPTLRGVWAVPVTAVRVDAAGQAVFRIVGDRLERLPATPGARVGDRLVIEAALREGDRIVAADAAAMDVRRRVRVRGEAAP